MAESRRLQVLRARQPAACDRTVVLGASDYAPPLRALGAEPAPWDIWWSQGDVVGTVQDHAHLGACVSQAWCSDGDWAFGRLRLPESRASGLQAVAQQAYTWLFATLERAGTPHLLRLWNYLPRINQDQAGLERYRHFNLGRQAAFLQAGRSTLDGAPAACALGCPDDSDGAALTLYFLAGRQPVVAVENPRQVSAYRYPSRYGPAAPTFSRAALADVGGAGPGLFVSGTASIVGHETVHVGDVRAQTRETVTNLRAVCAAATQRAGRCFAAEDLELVVYLRHPGDLTAVRDELAATLGAASPALQGAIFVQADVCRADLLMEVEAHCLPGPGPAR